jgi:hypothetical protein
VRRAGWRPGRPAVRLPFPPADPVASTAEASLARLSTAQRFAVDRGRLRLGPETESIIQQSPESLVAGGDCIAHAERGFGSKGQPPAGLVQLVDCNAALGGVERAARWLSAQG